MTATPLLRPGALAGRAVVAGGAYATACETAGAAIVGADAAWVDLLVVDAAPAFGEGGRDGLRAALDGTWRVVRAVAERHWLTERGDHDRGAGKLVVVAPRAAAGEYAVAAAAALENLARTLAVEWARYGVRATAIAPGPRTADDELAALVAFLASAGGEYFSGCRFDPR
jgi:NAD(P)-dependent dehydrogenase (short-subunit alcohol dehydrogenase family)